MPTEQYVHFLIWSNFLLSVIGSLNCSPIQNFQCDVHQLADACPGIAGSPLPPPAKSPQPQPKPTETGVLTSLVTGLVALLMVCICVDALQLGGLCCLRVSFS